MKFENHPFDGVYTERSRSAQGKPFNCIQGKPFDQAQDKAVEQAKET